MVGHHASGVVMLRAMKQLVEHGLTRHLVPP